MTGSYPVSAHVCQETAREGDELGAEVERLRLLAIWLIRLDEPDGIEERRTVTLTKITDRARQALEGPTLHRLEDVAEEFGVDPTEGDPDE